MANQEEQAKVSTTIGCTFYFSCDEFKAKDFAGIHLRKLYVCMEITLSFALRIYNDFLHSSYTRMGRVGWILPWQRARGCHTRKHAPFPRP